MAQQLPAVTQPPPAISFSDWREVSRPEGAVEYLVSFPSVYRSGFAENDVVPLRVFLPEPRPASMPVVLILHYWGATDLRVERALASELNRRGIGAAILTLPFHLQRTPKGARSGELAIRPDPELMTGTMLQSVYDTRRALDFLGSRSEFQSSPIGLAGTSLGALVAAMVYAIDSRVTHASFLLGGVDFARILWSSSVVVGQREALRRRGFTEERLRAALAPIEPLNYLPQRQGGSTFVVGGLYDTVIPRRSTEELIEALDEPRVLWLDTGHYGGIFVQRRLMREVAGFFAREFTGGTFVAPKRLYAPTIRVGVRVGTPGGIDLGIGLDLFKFNRRGDAFASVFITPRGPQIFAGQRLSQGLAFGVTGSSRGLGIGFLWSTVL